MTISRYNWIELNWTELDLIESNRNVSGVERPRKLYRKVTVGQGMQLEDKRSEKCEQAVGALSAQLRSVKRMASSVRLRSCVCFIRTGRRCNFNCNCWGVKLWRIIRWRRSGGQQVNESAGKRPADWQSAGCNQWLDDRSLASWNWLNWVVVQSTESST